MRFGNMFARFIEKIRVFMYGRYGMDSLNIALLVFGCLLSSALSIVRTRQLYVLLLIRLIGYIPCLIALMRALSKNIPARQKEYVRFSKFIAPWKRFFLQKYRQAQDTDHKYYNCPKCRNVLRVPKFRGKIKISCPHCGKEFVKNTGKPVE